MALLSALAIPVMAISAPTLPTIMQDEYVYSIGSRFESRYANDFGNHIFMLVYGLTSVFGENYYLAAKAINVVIQTFGAFGVFILATRYLPRNFSLVFSVGYLLGPNLLYTSVFMPDVFHGAIVIWLFYLTIRAVDNHYLSFAWQIGLGLISALALLVKFHAIAAVMAVFIFLAITQVGQSQSLLRRLTRPLGYLGLTYGFWVALAWLFSGQLWILPIGDSYFSSLSSLLPFSQLELVSIGGVAATVFVLAIILLSSRRITRVEENGKVNLFVLVLSSFVTYVLLVVAFTIFISATGDDHSQRLLLRHFEFLIPLLVLAGAVALLDKNSNYWKLTFVIAISSIWTVAFAGAFGLTLFSDSSFVYAMDRGGLFPVLVSYASVGAFLVMGLRSRNFSKQKLAPYLALVALITPSLFGLVERSLNASDEVTADFAGQQARSLSLEYGVEKVVVVSSNLQDAFLAMMWVDDPSSEYVRELDYQGLLKLTEEQRALVVVLNPVEGLGGDIQENGYSIFLPESSPG